MLKELFFDNYLQFVIEISHYQNNLTSSIRPITNLSHLILFLFDTTIFKKEFANYNPYYDNLPEYDFYEDNYDKPESKTIKWYWDGPWDLIDWKIYEYCGKEISINVDGNSLMSLFGTIYCENKEFEMLYEKYFWILWRDLINSYIQWYFFDNSILNLDHELDKEEKQMLVNKINEKINYIDNNLKEKESLKKLLSLIKIE